MVIIQGSGLMKQPFSQMLLEEKEKGGGGEYIVSGSFHLDVKDISTASYFTAEASYTDPLRVGG